MAIIVNLDIMLAKRKMTSLELANRIGMTQANLSILKTGKAKAVRISTMEALCRELTPVERTAIIIAFYCCTVFIGAALWNIDRLLSEILKGQVFIRRNVRRIRAIGWCCGAVSLICLPASFAYMPLIFMLIVMAFLCLVVSVVAGVMDAAVTIREENDLTV